jgi:biopolymer transport protein ExbD
MRIPSPSHRRRARIEIIPLIDIVFFLLATFVMVSLSMIKNEGIPVTLPRAASGVGHPKKDPVTITVKKNGDIYLDKTEVSLSQLVQKLRVVKATHPDASIIINGDDSSRLGAVVTILDKLRYIGFQQVSILTRN